MYCTLSHNLLYYYADYNQSEIVPPEVSSVSEDDATTPTYAYYIIGIGSAVLLIALTLVICCCAYTCYVRWNNARSNKKLPPSFADPWGLYSVSNLLMLC